MPVDPEVRRDSLLVEFFGLPGVGKSELSRRLAGRLQPLAVPVHQPSYELAHGIGRLARAARKSACVAREIGMHPLATARSARVLAASGQPSTGRSARLLFNWLLVTSLARRARRRRGLHLIDEGPLQGAWSVALEGRVESALELLQRLPAGVAPDLVVIVEASPAVVAGRLRSRPEHDSRLDLRLDKQPQLLQRGASTAAAICAALPSIVRRHGAAGSIVVSNENSDDLEACAGELATVLESAARAAGMFEGRPIAASEVSPGS